MNTRYFKVKGMIDYSFVSPSGSEIVTLNGIEVQLWHHAPLAVSSIVTGKLIAV